MKHKLAFIVTQSDDHEKDIEEARRQFGAFAGVTFELPRTFMLHEYLSRPMESALIRSGANLLLFRPQFYEPPGSADAMWKLAIDERKYDFRALAHAWDGKPPSPERAQQFANAATFAHELRWLATRRQCELGFLRSRPKT